VSTWCIGADTDTYCSQMADILEDKAQTITEKTPGFTEDLQSKAEEHAGKLSENARPVADQASEAIHGGARRVAEGKHWKPRTSLEVQTV